ncbi:GH25 family lysozyme [Candidatus Stoquefichus massiliensis]|uniref:GH25 family lysozyme n=1 Tax=Candidatus Stoquefichus massiliensis TaxID=1470350 RepID=UPI0004B67254|nr:GH25 family lysozyme [Candidatus Stoquefichus massiliensis]
MKKYLIASVIISFIILLVNPVKNVLADDIVNQEQHEGIANAEQQKYDDWINGTDEKSRLFNQVSMFRTSSSPYWKGRNFYDANDNLFGISNSKKIIDISKHNGKIDWQKVKNSKEIDGVIVRLGYGWYSDQIDEQAKNNIDALNRLNIPYGVYLYSYAANADEAKKEADFFASLIKKLNVKNTYPIYYDLENWSYKENGVKLTAPKSTKVYEQIVSSFMDTMKNHGYTADVYSYRSYLQGVLNSPKILKYVSWVAAYTKTLGYVNHDYTNDLYGWQYTSSGNVSGINGRVDISAFNSEARLSYTAHSEKYGWLDSVNKKEVAGITGESLRLEGLKINIENKNINGSIKYSTHIQDIGWTAWKQDGQISGTTGKALQIEGIKIKLDGDISNKYDIYYRLHIQNEGWLEWSKNGAISGSVGKKLRAEAIQIEMVKKGDEAPGKTIKTSFYGGSKLKYSSHVQTYGDTPYVSEGAISGTVGKALRMENIKIDIESLLQKTGMSGNISYITHVQNDGWLNWSSNNSVNGTSGNALRLEAIKIKLTGEISNYYDIYYRLHIQNKGWLNWSKNGEVSGTIGQSLRAEAIQIQIVNKGAYPI